MAKATRNQKFARPVVMTRKRGFKNTEHGPEWLGKVVNAVAAGTPADQKAHPISYHGQAPHVQNDMSEPIAARPAAIPAEPCDLPGTSDQVRELGGQNVPTHPHTKGASAGPKVPATCGGK